MSSSSDSDVKGRLQSGRKASSDRLSQIDTVHRWQAKTFSEKQRKAADTFFRGGLPQFVYGSDALRHMPKETVPEVAFLGRSNVGKSSLLNKLLGSRIVKTSSQAGQTQKLNAFQVGRPNEHICLVDTPGYGFKSRTNHGLAVIEYLRKRRSLRRTFLLIEASHSLKQSDMALADALIRYGVPFQFILSKVDKLKDRTAFDAIGQWLEDRLKTEPAVYGEVIGVCNIGQSPAITSLRCSILDACNKLPQSA